MNVLVVGSGGREHALCWKFSKSPLLSRLYCLPGNPGISAHARLLPGRGENIEEVISACKEHDIELVVVGPELPLTLGLTDALQAEGIKVFGPSKAAARLEGSKSFAKDVMHAAGVPTAASRTASSLAQATTMLSRMEWPCVVKADGLAAGKGVFICSTRAEAEQALQRVFTDLRSDRVILEEYLDGVEASLIVMTNGEQIISLDSSHDYKRLLDRHQGPNTGGMGTVSPSNRITQGQLQSAVNTIIVPTLHEMKERGAPFKGFLYAGLMILPNGEFRVLEFNVRLGDPETQVLLARRSGDLLEAILYLLGVQEAPPERTYSEDAAVCVVVAAPGYPDSPQTGSVITGLEQAQELEGVLIFHAGTKKGDSGEIVSSGGRVLSVVGVADSIDAARDRAYCACQQIRLLGAQMRSDIGVS